MSLIKCPECGKEISDKSDKCIHCGYPLKKHTIINNKEYDLSYELNLVLNNRNIEAIKSVREKTGLGLADGKSIIDYMVENKECPLKLYFEVQESTTPHCPTCKSTDLKKISGLSKAGSFAMWGFFSQKVKKTYHCNNCGYEW